MRKMQKEVKIKEVGVTVDKVITKEGLVQIKIRGKSEENTEAFKKTIEENLGEQVSVEVITGGKTCSYVVY